MYSITLTQPFATLCVAPLLRDLVLLRSWFPDEMLRSVDGPVRIAAGAPAKLNETRSFRPHAAAVGPRVVIHAGKGDAGQRSALIDSTTGRLREPYASAVKACGFSDKDPWTADAAYRRAEWRLATPEHRLQLADGGHQPLPLGAAVGLVTFTGAEHTIRWWNLKSLGKTHEADWLLGNWAPQRFAWHMDNPALIPVPVPCRGFQMIWKTDAATDAAITAQGVT